MWAPCADWILYAEPTAGGSFKQGGMVDFVCEYTPFGRIAWTCLSKGSINLAEFREDHTQDRDRGYKQSDRRWLVDRATGLLIPGIRDCPKYAFIDQNKTLILQRLGAFVDYCYKIGPRRAAYALLGLRRQLPLPRDVLKLIAGLVIDSWVDREAWAEQTDAWMNGYIETHRRLKKIKI